VTTRTKEGGRIMAAVVHDDTFTPDVIADPYTYYGRLRDEDPVHWNNTYGLWVITRHDDVTWMTRHNELFSSAVFRNDPRPAYPAIDESDLGLYEYVRNYQADQFIQHDRPEHLDMRKIVHGYFTPKAMESWRPFVVNAVKELLDAAEEKGSMDVMRDLATPLPVLASGEKKGVFTRHQVLVNTSLLLLAGHETTINLLCNGTLAFIQHPDQWALYKEDPVGRAKWATEECLRYDAPVKSIQRLASQDIEVRGKVMEKNDSIRWFMSSAKRDPHVS